MAKEKSAAKLAKAERKAARKVQKEEAKAAKVERNAVKKAKSDKKEKKEKKEKRKVLAEKALNELEGESKATKDSKTGEESEEDQDKDEEVEVEVNARVINGDGGEDEAEDEGEGDEEEAEPGKVVVNAAEEKVLTKRPVGALVPFANPLADDKVAKKVFKSIKKGMALFCLVLPAPS